MGKIPNIEEYEENIHIKGLEVYRYMNFNEMPQYDVLQYDVLNVEK